MFDGDSADMCVRKFPLMSMGGLAEGLSCEDPGAKMFRLFFWVAFSHLPLMILLVMFIFLIKILARTMFSEHV